MIFGIIFLPIILFLPGFLLTRILLGEREIVELLVLSIGLSLVILVLIGLLLNFFGGITGLGLWVSYILILSILLPFFMIKTQK